MARLQTARLAANDLFSSYPKGQGGLEADLATIFGFSPNTDITESPLSLDNSGRVTKPLLRTYSHGVAPLSGLGIGLGIENSSNSTTAAATYSAASGSHDNTFRIESGQGLTGVTRFSIDMHTGALFGATAQAGAGVTPLIPATNAGSEAFYNALGQFATPGGIPIDGCLVSGGLLNTVHGGITMDMAWLETPIFDVNTHFDGDRKIYAVETGKYFVNANIPIYTLTPAGGLDATVDLVLNNTFTTPLSRTRLVLAGSTTRPYVFGYAQVSSLVNMTNAGDYVHVYVTNNLTGDINCCFDPPGALPLAFNGRFSAFRVDD